MPSVLRIARRIEHDLNGLPGQRHADGQRETTRHESLQDFHQVHCVIHSFACQRSICEPPEERRTQWNLDASKFHGTRERRSLMRQRNAQTQCTCTCTFSYRFACALPVTVKVSRAPMSDSAPRLL